MPVRRSRVSALLMNDSVSVLGSNVQVISIAISAIKIGANAWNLIEACTSPSSNSMHARVNPQPGQGIPVNLKKAHSQAGRCRAIAATLRLRAPVSNNPNLRSRKRVAIGEKAVLGNIEGGIL